ncbi:MAG: PLDc N-terminal domain-containing protein [Lachnospiraceae bacterium]|nr:PLDc N-terminal domain-containing protein [Lachnospiraceae bacterium]
MGETQNKRRRGKKGFVRTYVSGTIRAAVTALLVILQFSIIVALAYFLTEQQLVIYYALQVVCTLVIIMLVNKKSSPAYKLAWMTIIAVLPVMGLIMYILWGRDTGKRLRRGIMKSFEYGYSFESRDEACEAAFAERFPDRVRFKNYMENSHFPLYGGNRISYYPFGEDAFEAIVEDLERAEKFVLISFFIVGDGILWEKIHEILKEKAKKGVKILFLYDDFGSMFRTDKHFREELGAEGIEARVFNPIHRYVDKLYMNFRNHQKIVVIDGDIGYTGGFNLADEYINAVERFGVWKDNGVRIEGEGVFGLTMTFLGMWNSCEKKAANKAAQNYEDFRPVKKSGKAAPAANDGQRDGNAAEERDKTATPADGTADSRADGTFAQIIYDGPASNPEHTVESVFRQFVTGSKDYLYITTPYLVLEDSMADSLVEAVRGGVDVRIITPNIPDKKMVKLATQYNYGELLKAGVRIYEYTPGFIHAKTLITSDCCVVGTINMDYRSFYLHYECGAFMWGEQAVSDVLADFEKTMGESREITYEEWLGRPWHTKLAQSIIRLFSTLL